MTQISERVQEELNEAAAHIRNALSFAARTEKPAIIEYISRVLNSIENVKAVDEGIDIIEKYRETIKKLVIKDGESPTL